VTSDRSTLFDTTWIHAFEEDTKDASVFRPETSDLPLSRRPRQRLRLSPDGSAHLVVSGPDDRLHEVEARWTEEEGGITVTPTRAAGSVSRLRIQVAGKDRLLARR
jgi:hypothetical protein